MANSRLLLRPQFFHTLLPGSHTHLMIPEDFFSKYIEEEGGVSATAELKSDAADRTWKAKMTGRRLGEGWREFAVANNLRFGGVILVRYEGDMVFHVSNLGQNCCEIQDISPACGVKSDKTLLKKRLYGRTLVDRCDYEDDIELPRNKKVKMKSPEAEEPLSSSDNSCFVALVTPSSLRTDKLFLPQHVTSSNGLTTKCRKIVLVDGGEKSWTLDLSFNKSSDTFYMSRGWRNFCEENGQEPGGFFMFKLVGNGETPVLSLGLTESNNDTRYCAQASERESLSTEPSSKDEYIQGESSEEDCSSMDSLMEAGVSFSLCSADSTSDSEQEEYSKAIKKQSLFKDPSNIDNSSKDQNNKEENMSWERKKRGRDSTPSSLKQFVTLTITPSSVRQCRLGLLKSFTRDNDINKPGMITLLGRDGTRHQTRLVFDKVKRIMALEGGWKDFAEANGLKTGDSFTLKLIWEDTTPVLSLCPEECSFDSGQGGCSETIQKKSPPPIERSSCGKVIKERNNRENDSKEETRSMEKEKNQVRGRDSTSSSKKQFVILKITPSCFIQCRLVLPAQFARENSINKLRMIYLLGRDGRKWLTKVQQDKKGRVSLGNGWRDFAEGNNFKSGDSFTMELIWEGETRMLRLSGAESSSLKAYVSTEHGSSSDSSSAIQNRSVTLTLTPEEVRACKMHLPSEFMKANGINRLGKITLLGENKREWSAYLLTRDGTVALGIGWDEFCEANGVSLGESFTLEFSKEQNKTTPVLQFCSLETLTKR